MLGSRPPEAASPKLLDRIATPAATTGRVAAIWKQLRHQRPMPHAVVRRRLADDLPERAAEGPRAGEAAMGARPRSDTSTKVDTKNPVRGPLLIISGEKDNTVPWAIANASYKRQKRNQAVTEIIEMPNRGHGLVIDSGWREVADTALTFVQRFVR